MKKILLVLGLVFSLSGCATMSPVSNVIASPSIDVGSIKNSDQACSYYVLGLIGPFGDNSLVSAAKYANITKVVYYDQSFEFYVLFGKKCNRVYGY